MPPKRLRADNRADLIAVDIKVSNIDLSDDALHAFINAAVKSEGKPKTTALILSIFLIILVACGTSEEESQGQIDDVVNLALEEATTSTSTTSTTSTSTTTMPVSVVEVMPNIEIACKPIKNQDGYLFFNI